MGYGSTGKILRVNLTTASIEEQEISEELYRLYPGGKALAGYFLLKELPAHTDPFSPDNVLIFANGLLTGSPVATATRFVVTARSPLTMAYGESEAGGFWGPELKMAGIEAIVVTGKAAEPVYLWLENGNAEIRPADHLWGRTPVEVQTQIRVEVQDDKARILQIGPAGEKLVRYAAITNELRHFNGRNGMGAVMGSKKLRAIAVRGRQRYLKIAFDPASLSALGNKLAKGVKNNPQSLDLQLRGTPGLVEGLNAGGILPTLNFRQGAFDRVDELKWETYEKEIYTANRTCYACAVRCKREALVDGKISAYGGPEYETLAAFGSNCGIHDIHAISKANEMCNEFTLDTISTGSAISFAMECFEHGLIGLEDTGGIDLRFGNTQAMLRMIEMIGTRQGLGDLLAEGTRRAAEKIGGDSHFFAMQVKGQEIAMHDPRGKYNVGIGYAISEIGAEHLVVPHDPMLANAESAPFKNSIILGIRNALPPRSLGDEKMEQFHILERWNSMEKTTGLCFFGPAPRSFILPEEVLDSIRFATGWDITLEEALEIGERGTNLARVFNAREGFTRQDDRLPERLFQGLENGALVGESIPRQEFEQALTRLYELKGWDPQTAAPTRQRLEELSLGWAADLLEQSG
jgi:aldehyde:ferredoxin oxidoreductase